MKKHWLKIIGFAVVFVMITGILSGCDNNGEADASSVLSLEISQNSKDESKDSETSATELSETIAELEKEIDRLEALLSIEDTDKEELESRINELEETLAIKLQIIKDQEDYISRLISSLNKKYFESLKEPQEIVIDDGYYLILELSTHEQDLTIFYPDGSSVKIVEDFYLRILKLSPSRSKIIINNFRLEDHTETYLYNIETKENELLELELPTDHDPSYLDWLDDRYLLLVVQLDYGSVVRGGNVYIYDTETGDYAMIIESSTNLFQTYKFDMYRENLVVFTSLLYEETLNFTEEMHRALSYDEIFELYKNKETFDLYTQK